MALRALLHVSFCSFASHTTMEAKLPVGQERDLVSRHFVSCSSG